MTDYRSNNISKILYNYFPVILLFISVMNHFDFNNIQIKFLAFNFSYILIFFYTLKRKDAIGYVSLFVAGVFNDVIIGLPMGISSIFFLLLCGFASYLRNITLRPNLIKDWIYFLVTLLILNSLSYISLAFIFEYDINFIDSMISTSSTFFFYIIFTYIFNFIENFFRGFRNAE